MSIAINVETKSGPMRDINVAVVGCGGIAEGKHLPAIKKLGNVKIVAFCDIIVERAEKCAKEYGIEGARTYDNHKDLLANEKDIEIVYVLTPNSSHSEIACASMDAGMHVMCEKPMAHTAAAARAMVESAKKNGKKLTIGYQTRSTPSFQLARKLVEDGAIGEIYYCKAPAIRRRGVPLWGVFLDKEKQGGGPMIDIGTHSIDAALYVMNNYEVESVTGSVYRKLADTAYMSNGWGIWDPAEFQVEDSAMGYVKFKNGATLVVEATWAINLEDGGCTTFAGTKAGMEMRDGVIVNGEVHGALYTQKIHPTSTSRDRFKGEDLTAEQYEAKQFIYCVINDETPLTTPEQAVVVSEIIEAIYESAKSGKTIYFN